VFDQRIALAGAQPREVFLQVFEKALEASQVEVKTDEAAVCKDDLCDIPEK
jgi:predicted DsbA family dithiol-disulfide isomerase